MTKECNNVKRFCLTGMPGSGKSSVIGELKAKGYSVVWEAATEIILQEQANDNLEPWQFPSFIDQLVTRQKQLQCASQSDLQFFDRSPFCTYALAKYLKFQPSAVLMAEIERCLQEEVYEKQVFFFENLGALEATAARRISHEDAISFEKMHIETYRQFGFDIVFVPKAPVIQRCDFIVHWIDQLIAKHFSPVFFVKASPILH